MNVIKRQFWFYILKISKGFSLFSVPPGLPKRCYLPTKWPFCHVLGGSSCLQGFKSALAEPPFYLTRNSSGGCIHDVPALPAAVLIPEHVRKEKWGVAFENDSWNLEKSSNEDSPILSSSHTITASLDSFKFCLFLRPPALLGSFTLSLLIVSTRGKSSELPMQGKEIPTTLLYPREHRKPRENIQKEHTDCMSGLQFFQAVVIWAFNYLLRYVRTGDNITGKAHNSLLALHQW